MARREIRPYVKWSLKWLKTINRKLQESGRDCLQKVIVYLKFQLKDFGLENFGVWQKRSLMWSGRSWRFYRSFLSCLACCVGLTAELGKFRPSFLFSDIEKRDKWSVAFTWLEFNRFLGCTQSKAEGHSVQVWCQRTSCRYRDAGSGYFVIKSHHWQHHHDQHHYHIEI